MCALLLEGFTYVSNGGAMKEIIHKPLISNVLADSSVKRRMPMCHTNESIVTVLGRTGARSGIGRGIFHPDHEDADVGGRDAGNAGGLANGGRQYFGKLLTGFGAEA